MKTRIKYLILSVSLCLCGLLSARAQTNAPPATPQSFVTSVQSYFTSFDTNSTTFSNRKFDLWTGMDYVQGVNTAASLGLEYQISSGFAVESVTRNAGIAGIILSQQGGIGYSIVHYDTKITGYLDGGYDFDGKRTFAEIGVRAKKALSANTYLGIGISTRYPGGRTPTFSVFTGFTF